MTLNLDQQNAIFWDHICGSVQARRLGISDVNLESIKKFDDWYFGFYPYLLPYINPDMMRNKTVLEVGLGYGSVGQKLAEAGAHYLGVDIASGPVNMMQYRLSAHGLSGEAIQGNILYNTFQDNHFDYVVSIGCLYHTGDVQRCIDEIYRILKPGGTAILMVYNQLSYRQWYQWPSHTFKAMLHSYGIRQSAPQVSDELRSLFDTNSEGEAAPETVLLSIRQLTKMVSRFSLAHFTKQNCDAIRQLGLKVSRKRLLSTLGQLWGLDIYFTLTK